MLVALLLIFFYLLCYVVKPIFNGASVRRLLPSGCRPQGKTAWLGVEEQNE